MRFHAEYLTYGGDVRAHFWTDPPAFGAWLPCPNIAVCTPEFLQKFKDQQIAKIRKIPQRLWIPAWINNQEKADEYRKFT